MPRTKKRSQRQRKEKDRDRKRKSLENGGPPEKLSRRIKPTDYSLDAQKISLLIGNDNTQIPDDVIEFSIHLMRAFNKTKYIGYYTPAELHFFVNSNESLPAKEIIPPDQFSINFHPLPGHWVTSCQLPHLQEIHVYDSLMSDLHWQQVLPQVQLLYGHKSMQKVFYKRVTQQSSLPICGIMSIAYAFSCFLGEDCTEMNFDIQQAREHLRSCVLLQEIKSFPVINCETKTFPIQMETYCDVTAQRECLHQHQKEKNKHRQEIFREKLSDTKKLQLKRLDKERQKQYRQNLSQSEEKVIKLKDKIRHEQHRKSLDDSRKAEIKCQDTQQHKQKRDTLTKKETEIFRQKNTENRRKGRKQLIETEVVSLKQQNKQQHRQQRQQLTEEKKERLKIQNKVQHRQQRQQLNEERKEKLKQKNKVQHKQKREQLTEEKKENLKQQNKQQHRQQREKLTQAEKEKLLQQNKQQHKQQRQQLTEEKKVNLKQQNKQQHRQQREELTKDKKEKLKIQDKVQHRKQREQLNEGKKEKVKQQNNQQHRKQREQLNEEKKEKVKQQNNQQHRQQREQLNEEKKEKVKQQNNQQHRKQREQLNEEKKEKVKQQNNQQHRQQREQLNEEKKEKVKQQNNQQHRKQREQLNEEKKEKVKQQNNQQHRQQREQLSKERKEIVKQHNKQQHIQQRSKLSEEQKETQKQQNKNRKKKSRENNEIDVAIANYDLSIRNGPDFTCVSCCRMLYKSNVMHFKKINYKKICEWELQQFCALRVPFAENIWICKQCHKYLKKGSMPPQCQANQLSLEPIPAQLNSLCSLEIQLVSKILPFMKIVALHKGAQHGLHGQVVLVPADLTKVTNCLPRATSDSHIITLALKRRLSDKHAVHKQCIRPQIVNAAIQFLKNHSPFYSDVIINGEWTDNSSSQNPELWTKITPTDDVTEDTYQGIDDLGTTEIPNQITDDEVITDSEDEIDAHSPWEVNEHMQQKAALNSVTCFQPVDGPQVGTNDVLNLAPAEGQVPTSDFKEPSWEALAFPHLFPTGKNILNVNRKVKLSLKKYANVRLLNKDTRFAECPEYIFQILDLLEKTNVQNTISITTRKSYFEDISVGHLKDPTRFHRLLKQDQLYATFKNVRGTPQYWQQMQMDMLAKLRQLGPYTFFLTGSAAEFHWPEVIQVVARQYGTHLTKEDIDLMNWTTKRQWLQRNPVTVAKHIDYMFEQLWSKVILSGAHPIGQILNYDRRKEMQGRGTEHFHSAIHVKDAPIVDVDTDSDCIAFVNKHISCQIPTTHDDELKQLVISRQTHHHTRTCKKKNTHCRFGYPRPPSPSTLITRKPNTEENKKKAQNVLGKVYKVLNENAAVGNLTLEQVLDLAGVTEEDYMAALLTAQRRTSMIMKRNVNEIFINNYNPHILKALKSNMDIQFITDIWACIAYLTSYMCKPERNMSELMRKACKEATQKNIRQALKDVGDVFRKCREISEHEAISRILSLPLRRSNIDVIFIQTDLKENRTRMLKPKYILDQMEDDDTDIYLPTTHDKYAKRPDSLETLSFAEFCACYNTSSASSQTETDSDIDDHDISSSNTPCSRTKYHLKDGMGIITKRAHPRVIRYHYVSKEKDEEMYYHRLLILYSPWRSECELKETSFKDHFFKVKDHILPTIKRFEPFYEEVEHILDTFDPDETAPDMWNEMAAQIEQELSDTANEDVQYEYPHLDPDLLPHDNNTSTPKTQPLSFTISKTHIASDPQFYNMVQSLNEKQRYLFDFMFNWATQTRLKSISNETVKPFYIFLSGGGGVGKTHTVNTIYEGLVRALREPGHDPEKPTVLMTASTGKAASNINGTTLHSAFSLPVREKSKSFQYKKISAEKLNTLRCKYQNLKVIIADEISMFGGTSLQHLDLALQSIFQNPQSSVPFGGISILAVGDLMQLNPVGDCPVFRHPSKSSYAALAGSLWQDLFQFHELTEIVRQKGDPLFAEILSRVRTGHTTAEDIQSLQELEKTDSSQFPPDAVHLFMTNEQVSKYNHEKLNFLPLPHITVTAKDSKRDLHTNTQEVVVMSNNIYQTGGLPSSLTFAKGARLMLTKKYDTADHLVNGVIGRVAEFHIPENNPLSGKIYLEFDNCVVGQSKKKNSPLHLRHTVPIEAITVRFLLGSHCPVPVERQMFPLVLAYGLTAHKSQGSTYQYMVADFTKPKKLSPPQGLAYTMLSRATSRKGIKIVNFSSADIKVNQHAADEMERMRIESSLTWKHPITELPPLHTSIGHLNIRSLVKHSADLRRDQAIYKLQVLCMSETHISKVENCCAIKGYKLFIKDTKHGLGIYISENITDVNFHDVPSTDSCQALAIDMSTKGISSTIVAVYHPPSELYSQFQHDFSALLQCIQPATQNVLLLGDFNIDANTPSFQALLRQHNLLNIMKQPTHFHGRTLDLIITSNPQLPSNSFPVPYSDHHLIWTALY